MANDEDVRWARAFLSHEAIASYDRSPGATSYQHSAEALRRVIRSGLLRFTDLRDRPRRFFDAHRLLATRVLGGFGIRFTVQFNLFAGSVLGLGTPEQVAMLEDFQRAGSLGCFALTEVGAGVSSGLVVETTATYDVARGGFRLRTPNARAAKNWISQGLTAEWCVVMADLILPSGGRGGHFGPHPFLMRLRDGPGGALVRGVTAEDMGGKTVANDLDNARLSFGEGCFLARGALLGRFCAVHADGTYESRAPNGASRLKIEVIGQRLLTGRLCIASAALVATRVLFARTRVYTDARRVAGQDGAKGECMTTLPQVADLYARTDATLARMERFCAAVETELEAHLKKGTTPPDALVEAIGVAKIRAVRAGIEAAHKLKHEVGSFALMRAADGERDSVHGDTDLLWCCKFAEGDSRILLQKIARDRLKRAAKGGVVGMLGELVAGGAEGRSALALARRLQGDGADLAAWHRAWVDVYALAETVCDRHIASRL